MRAQFLGTAASEGYPDPFCDCANCQRARELGGSNLRKRCALLIDDELLIDLGPDLLAASQRHNIPLTRLRYCLQTHEHQDHLHTDFFLARSPYCGVHDAPPLDFYGTEGALAQIRGDLPHFARLGEDEASARLRLTLHPIAPFQTLAVGPYRVSTLLAAHDPTLVPLLYVVECDGCALFYATDTGPLPEATWAALRAWDGRLDAVIMDHTFGYNAASASHLNGEQFRAEIAQLRDHNLLADDAHIYATHLAHHSNLPHETLVAEAAAHGYLVAHDGLAIAI